jgi:hypothetical protein
MDKDDTLDLCLDALTASTEYITALRQFIYSRNPEHHDYAKLDILSQAEWPLRELAIKKLNERKQRNRY